jgi:hypothetical protein
MGRIARVIAVGLPHHITQRGMDGEPFSMQRKTVRFTCNCYARMASATPFAGGVIV